MSEQPSRSSLHRAALYVAVTGAAAIAVVVVGAVAAPGVARAAGDVTGRIRGTVTSAETKQPLPGIDIKVSGPTLIGGPRLVTANDDGSYEVVELPAGVYDVEVGFPGAEPARRRIQVRQGQSAPLDIAWSAQMQQVKEYHVVEERHPTNPDSTQTGAVVTKDQEAKLATGRSYNAMMRQAAGTMDAEGEGNGNFQVKGGSPFMNTYMMDGLILTDVVTNTSNGAFNFDSIQSVQIMTGGFEAQYNSLGGVVNVVSVGGSDRLHIDSSVYVNNANLRIAEQTGPALYDKQRPFYGAYTVPPNESYTVNLNVSGPIIKQKLWYAVSFEYARTRSSALLGGPIGIQHPARHTDSFRPRFKLQWMATPKDQLTLTAFADPSYFNNNNQGNSRLGVAENYIEAGGVFAIAQWDHFHSKDLNTNVQAGFYLNHFYSGPQGFFSHIDNNNDGTFSDANNHYDPNRPTHVNQEDGTTWYQGDPIQYDRRWGANLDPSISLRGKLFGQHDMKAGIQSRFIYHSFEARTPGGVSYADLGGGPLEGGLCDEAGGKTAGCYQRTDSPPFSQGHWGIGASAYIQDRWKPPFKRLTILPGLRLDYGYTRNSVGKTVSSLLGWGPRLGFTFDITNDRKTIFTGYYGRSNEVLSLMATGQADISGLSTTSQYDHGTGQWNMLRQSGGTSGYVIDKHLTPPHADSVELALRREVSAGTLASVTYTYKRIANVWDAVEINQVWNPAGTDVVRFANGVPEQIYKITTPDQNWRIYQGIDFEYEARPNDNFDLYLAYTVSWTYGPGGEEFGFNGVGSQFYNPRQAQFYDGYLQQDARHNIKVRASYSWRGLTAGVFANYRTGAALRRKFFNPYDGDYTMLRSPQGTEPAVPNDVKQIAEFRMPDNLNIDLRLQYDFHPLIKQHVSLIFDFFNVLNLREGCCDFRNAIAQNDDARFGLVNNRQAAFRVQLGLRYVY